MTNETDAPATGYTLLAVRRPDRPDQDSAVVVDLVQSCDVALTSMQTHHCCEHGSFVAIDVLAEMGYACAGAECNRLRSD
jgi:hypothetical protein